MKKLFKILFILLGIGFMGVVIVFALMMFAHISVAGYTWINILQDKGNLYAEVDANQITGSEVKSHNINVVIKYVETSLNDTIQINTQVKMQGIVKDTVKKVKYVEAPHIEDGILKIETVEPEGLFFVNNSHIEVVLPRTAGGQPFTMENKSITVNSGAKLISIGEMTVYDLNVTASKKFLNAAVSIDKDVTVNHELRLNTNYGRIIVNCTINGDLYVDSLAGSILVNKSIGGDLTVTGVNPLVEVGQLPGSWRNKKEFTDDDFAKIKKVDVMGQVTIKDITGGGNVKVSGTVYQDVMVNAKAVEFWANNINHGLNCNSGANNLRLYGRLGSNGENRNSTILTGDGSLFINKSYNSLDITADKGDVYVADAYNNVIINTTNSSATVHFNKAVSGKTVDITTERHNIEVTNINGVANLTAKDGKIKADFRLVSGTNNLTAKRDINVTVKDGSTFNLLVSATGGDVEVDMLTPELVFKGWGNAEKDAQGYYSRGGIVNDNGGAVSNYLNVKMTDWGKITANLYN